MNDLKTLKDIHGWRDYEQEIDETQADKKILRLEAIKWYKYYEDINPKMAIHADQIEIQQGIQRFIKMFFGLSEEEILNSCWTCGEHSPNSVGACVNCACKCHKEDLK